MEVCSSSGGKAVPNGHYSEGALLVGLGADPRDSGPESRGKCPLCRRWGGEGAGAWCPGSHL